MNTPPVSPPVPQTDVAVRKGIVSLVVGIVVIICIVGIASRMELTGTEVNSLLENARWECILPGWLLMCVAIIALGYRWKALIHPKHKTSGLFLACPLTAAILLNYAMPGPVGELTSAWFAHKKYGLPYEDALASGVAARLFGLCTAALGSGLIWFLFSMPVPEQVEVLLQSGVFGLTLGGLALLLLIHRPDLILSRVERLQSRLSPQGFVAKILGVMGSFLQALVRTGQLGGNNSLSNSHICLGNRSVGWKSLFMGIFLVWFGAFPDLFGRHHFGIWNHRFHGVDWFDLYPLHRHNL